MAPEDDDILDSLFHGCAWAAYIDQAVAYGDGRPFVRDNAREALNANITFMIALFIPMIGFFVTVAGGGLLASSSSDAGGAAFGGGFAICRARSWVNKPQPAPNWLHEE